MAKFYCQYTKVATVMIWTRNNLSNADAGELYQTMRPLMDRLRTEAAGGDLVRKFATGQTPGLGFSTIYGLMQCTPELSENECYNCLDPATNRILDLASRDGSRRNGTRRNGTKLVPTRNSSRAETCVGP
ncbi:putative Gnk2-like domain-containing protein [Helianthus annuus]|uniref:Gnk2-like domain-containing protein n=1 Tax=Helianthus annuus TaxID=4232 RepID=A0A251TFD0_HELAN|nr:putative Gnk2-like domain-containing protein [Helianthus annuus]KAJ0503617.1 putative Gnk2-like domain-containing protein [Helianthus annuus]KAJ0629880.1 putative Gnk2-like domain-containing protein [Helianthus annuus]